MSLPTFSAIESAQKDFNSKQILDSIAENAPEFGERIKEARSNNFSDDDILNILKEDRQRDTGEDIIATAAPELAFGAVTSPTAAARGALGVMDFVKDPLNATRQLLGFEPLDRKTPLESLVGRDRAGQILESTGLNQFDDFVSGLFQPDPGTLSGFTDIPAVAQGPNREELRQSVEQATGLDLTAQTPIGRVVQEGTGRFGESFPLFGAGVGRQFALGGVSGQGLREMDAPEGVANVADLALSLTSFEPVKPSALKRDPVGPEAPKFKKQLTKQKTSQLRSAINPIIEDASEPLGFSVKDRVQTPKVKIEPISDQQLARQVIQGEVPRLLDQIDPIKRTRKQSLQTIKNGIGEQFTRHKAVTSNLYNNVDAMIGESLIRLDDYLTESARLADEIETSGIPSSAQNSIRQHFSDQLELFNEDGSISVRNAIKLKQNSNNFTDFEFPDLQAKKTYKRLVSPVRNAAKQDLNNAIRSLDRDAFIEFRKAERSHQQDAETFGRDVVVKLQRGESPLNIIGDVTNPAEFEALKNALQVKNQEGFAPQVNTLERLVLEEINNRTTTPGNQRITEDIRPSLSQRSQDALEFIEKKNDPLVSKRPVLKKRVLDSVFEASETGQLPKFAIELGQTPQGLGIVREALRGSVQGRNALQSVERGIVNSIYDGFLSKDGLIEYQKLKEVLKNDDLMRVLRSIDGNTAFNTLADIESVVKATDQKIQDAFSRKAFAEKQRKVKGAAKAPEPAEPVFEEDPAGWLRHHGKEAVYGAALLKTLGIAPAIFKGVVGAHVVSKLLPRLLKNKRILSRLKFLKANPSPKAMETTILQLNKLIEEELKNDQE